MPSTLAAERPRDPLDHLRLAVVVDLDRRAHDPLIDAGLVGGLQQRQRVLGKAAAAIAGAGVQELGPDAIVEADPAGDVLDVGVDRLAQVGDLVDEADLDREEGVGGIFGELGGATAGDQDRRAVEEQGPVDFAQHVLRAVVLGADDDPVGMLEVGDRRAFAQELGVGRDRDVRSRPPRAGSASIRSPVPTGTVDLVTTTVPGLMTLASSRTASNTKVRSAWPSPRRAGVPTAMNTASASSTAGGKIGREGQPPALGIGLDQRLEPRLPDRHHAGVQPVDLAASLSTQQTRWPKSAKQAPETSPT